MFEEYLALYLNHLNNINRAEATRAQYKKELKNFFVFLKKKEITNIEDIKTIHIDLYQSHLIDKKNGTSSRAKKISIIRNFFTYLHSRDYLQKNPAGALEPIKIKDVDRKKRETLTVDEAYKLIEKITKNSIPSMRLRNRLIAMVFLLDGLRVSELCHLKVEHISIKEKTIYVMDGKGGKNREVPLFDEMIPDLKTYLKTRPHDSEYLFTKKHNGEPLIPRTVYALIKDHVAKAKIKKNIGCHSLRRTSASLQLLSGNNIRFIQQNLGHSNIGTTMLYLQVDKEEIKEDIRTKNILSKKIKKERQKEK